MQRPRSTVAGEAGATLVLLYTIYFIYFFCGMTHCFENVFLPEFKVHFVLNYQQQMYTMFARNIPFLFAVVIGLFVRRIGYKNCLTIAMLLYTAGTLLVPLGLRTRRYEVVLLGFLLIGVGFNFQLVAGNPLLCALGPAKNSSSRLNLGNALGAVAQIIAPGTLAIIVPVKVISVQGKLPYIEGVFIVLGVVLFLTAIGTLLAKSVDISESFKSPCSMSGAGFEGRSIWARPRVVLGFVTIFLILGVEATYFGFYRNYLEDPTIAGLSSHQSQLMYMVYLAVFAFGRLVASWVQKKVHPTTHLAFNVFAAMVSIGFVMFAKGTAAVVAVTALGFFISILFPTFYSVAIAGLGDLTGQASGLLTMGFVGSALIPVLQGKLADSVGLQYAYGAGLAAYLFAAFYALKGWRLESHIPAAHGRA